MFKKMKIDNFRGITHLELSDCKRINLIVGENNCGKTSVLEALFLLLNPGNPQLLNSINAFRGFSVITSEVLKTAFLESNINKNIKLDAELTDPSEKRTLKLSPVHIQNFIRSIQQEGRNGETRESLDLDSSLLKTTDTTREFNGINFEGEAKRKNEAAQAIRSALVLIDTTNPNAPLMQPYPDKNYAEKRRGGFVLSPANNFVHRFHKIKIAKQTEKIVNVLKIIEPSLKTLETGPDQLIYADTGSEHLLPINVMGGGFVKILSILTHLYDMNDGGIVFIDEIENGLHHSAQEHLWRAIIEAANQFNVQIFATTHSLETVDFFGKAIKKHKEDEFRLFRIEKKENVFDVIKYNSDNIKAIPDSDWEVR